MSPPHKACIEQRPSESINSNGRSLDGKKKTTLGERKRRRIQNNNNKNKTNKKEKKKKKKKKEREKEKKNAGRKEKKKRNCKFCKRDNRTGVEAAVGRHRS